METYDHNKAHIKDMWRDAKRQRLVDEFDTQSGVVMLASVIAVILIVVFITILVYNIAMLFN